ncbi:sigma-E processing peptidase SpoIIGA [Paenibacillus lutrae]|uniref:Sporulation sigma-E factor-processing peptidase n=1 Tax=Paenibacillus lutrae TaxID=2078573 RepID=A0A7X3JYX2_9BACL|nr:sigma-E processing peptidase SpoIIGA [Paenibacillus lutrae]MVO99360.1 sigma-E processing peptidase SpoIIGA [Paenibacillus lutrae]
MVVYADLIFLLNVVIDAAILLVTARTRRLSFNPWRMVISAALGASYVVMMFVPPLSFLFTFVIKLLVSLCMIWIAFGFGSLQQFLRTLGTFYLVNFAGAGGIFGLNYVFQTSGDIMNGILFSQTGATHFTLRIETWTVILLGGGTLVLYRLIFAGVKRKEELTAHLAEVTVVIEGVVFQCTGLIDTGNQLYDPLTRTPVMVMEASRLSEQLPDSWLKRIRAAEVEQIITAMGTEGEFVWQDRLRLIPYRGVNRSTQFMLAIKPDKVIITQSSGQVEATKVLIGLDGGQLSGDGAYHAIIHPKLVDAS